jgi:hypothetical protein
LPDDVGGDGAPPRAVRGEVSHYGVMTPLAGALPPGRVNRTGVIRLRGPRLDGLSAPLRLPVDLYMPGCPPHPLTVLDGLLRLVGRLEGRSAEAGRTGNG